MTSCSVGTGISREGDILDLASECGFVSKSGAWYAYEGNKIGQGRENTKAYLKEHPELMDELERKVRIYYHLLPGEEEDATGEMPDDNAVSSGDEKE